MQINKQQTEKKSINIGSKMDMDSAESVTASIQRNPFTRPRSYAEGFFRCSLFFRPFSIRIPLCAGPVCMEIFSIIFTFCLMLAFDLAVVWFSEWPRQKQTALMISVRCFWIDGACVCICICAISFVWCRFVSIFHAFAQKFDVHSSRVNSIKRMGWVRKVVWVLHISFYVCLSVCVCCSMMFNLSFLFWSFGRRIARYYGVNQESMQLNTKQRMTSLMKIPLSTNSQTQWIEFA